MDAHKTSDIDVGALKRARDALLGLAHTDERLVLQIALDNLIEIHEAGKVRLTQIDGPTNVLRKALREAWHTGAHAPLALSREPLARSLLIALPEGMPLTDHEDMSRTIARLSSNLPETASWIAAHMGRVKAYLDGVPVILSALDALPGLPRVFVKDEDAPRNDHRAMFALRRLRQAFVRDVAPLTDQVAVVAHKTEFGWMGSDAFPTTAKVLQDVPVTGIRRRDPAGVEWMSRLTDALAADVIQGNAGAKVEALIVAYPSLSMSKASVKHDGKLGARLSIVLAHGTATLTLTYRFDIGAGTLEPSASGTEPGKAPFDIPLGDEQGFLNRILTGTGGAATTSIAQAPRRCGPARKRP